MKYLKILNNLDFNPFTTLLFGLFFLLVGNVVFANSNEQAAQVRLAQSLADSLNSVDYDAINQIIDTTSMAEMIGKDIFDNKKDVKDFVKGFSQSARAGNFARQVFFAIENGAQAKYMGLVQDGGASRPLVRINYDEGGVEYMLLHYTENNKINDFYMASRGKTSSDSVAEALRLTISPSESLLSKLLGNKKVDKKALQIFRESSKLYVSGKFAEAYQKLMALPSDLQQQRSIIDIAITFSSQFDESEYRKQLAQLAKYYGDDPNTQFMLVDHYLYTGQFAKGQKSIDMLMKRFGEDGALFNLKGSLALQSKDFNDADAWFNKAITLEPDLEDPYWSRVTLKVETGEFGAAVETLKLLETKFSYEFSKENFETEPFYSEFVKSDAYASWSI